VEVPAGRFLEAAGAQKADVIGLSALLSTTMLYQRDVLELLRNKGLKQKYFVAVGGAPVTRPGPARSARTATPAAPTRRCRCWGPTARGGPMNFKEIARRAETGPLTQANDFLLKRVSANVLKLEKEFDVRWDGRTLVNLDDALADRCWQAGRSSCWPRACSA